MCGPPQHSLIVEIPAFLATDRAVIAWLYENCFTDHFLHIDPEHPPDGVFFSLQKEINGFHGLQTAYRAGGSTPYAKRGGRQGQITLIFCGFIVEAGIAWATVREESHNSADCAHYAGIDPGYVQGVTDTVQQLSGSSVIDTGKHKIMADYQGGSIAFGQSLRIRVDLDTGIEGLQMSGGTFGFKFPDVLGGIQDLTLQVTLFDAVAFHQ